MHTKPMSEAQGEFSKEEATNRKCRKCGGGPVTYKLWESSDGAYEDEKYTCQACGHYWWVEGIDS